MIIGGGGTNEVTVTETVAVLLFNAPSFPLNVKLSAHVARSWRICVGSRVNIINHN